MSLRSFSVTLSEDDLRPHKRKTRKPNKSIIENLEKKYKEREEKKLETLHKIDEEEKIKEQTRKDQEFQELWSQDQNDLKLSNISVKSGISSPSPRFQRYNNLRYFDWESDEEVGIRKSEEIGKKQKEIRLETPSASKSRPLDDFGECELCNLAQNALKIGNRGRNSACLHVTNFLNKHMN